MTLNGKNILLIISGGISAYKSLELIRLIRRKNGNVKCILTRGGSQFVTALSVAALSENKVFTDLWSLTDETEMGHIRLARDHDLIVIAPASANILAKMAHGIADDLASTTLLASNSTILAAPAMNPVMWQNPATQDNITTLKNRGVAFAGPAQGDMACGEHGLGRLLEPTEILEHIETILTVKPLKGKKAIVTSGPTFESIDPVRFIGNRSSGKQGHAIAAELYAAGAEVTLISGPVNISAPAGVNTINVETAQQMLDATTSSLPADIAVFAAAVSDWRAANISEQKIKKNMNSAPPDIKLIENQDILKTISCLKEKRPSLVIGFAAETEELLHNSKAKLAKKGCNWIIANDVSDGKVFAQNNNAITFVSQDKVETWPSMPKTEIAKMLVKAIISHVNKT